MHKLLNFVYYFLIFLTVVFGLITNLETPGQIFMFFLGFIGVVFLSEVKDRVNVAQRYRKVIYRGYSSKYRYNF